MKRTLFVFVLALSVMASTLVSTVFACNAVSEEDAAYDTVIMDGLKFGVISYAPDGRYRTRDTITEAEFAQMLFNISEGRPSVAVSGQDWWKRAAEWLYRKTGITISNPNAPATTHFMEEVVQLTTGKTIPRDEWKRLSSASPYSARGEAILLMVLLLE